MMGRNKQTIKNDSSDGFGTSRPVRLSAMMVDLSMRQDRADPRDDIPHSTKAKAPNSTVVATPEEKGHKAAQFDHGFMQASRELLRIFTSPVSIPALAFLAFTMLFAVRGHRTESIKRQSKSPATVQQRERPLVPVATVASESTPNDAHTIRPNKQKSRRRDDYIAKDTYVYYGKDGQPNHLNYAGR